MTTTHKTKGTSLANGPLGLIGVALVAYGITALIFGGHAVAACLRQYEYAGDQDAGSGAEAFPDHFEGGERFD